MIGKRICRVVGYALKPDYGFVNQNVKQRNVKRPFFRFSSTASVDQHPQPNTPAGSPDPKEFFRYLRQRIRGTGAFTVAEYMKECLTNPYYGYYSRKNPFGREGDFITSPEVCQIFGELIGVWIVNEWSLSGGISPMQIVELGGGTGVMAADILRIVKSFPQLKESVSYHIVEKSKDLAAKQAAVLGVSDFKLTKDEEHYQTGTSKYGFPVFWHINIHSVPEACGFFIGNEFWDALPVHKFHRKEDGTLREILVDINEDDSALRFALARQETPAAKLIPEAGLSRNHLEFSVEGCILANEIARRVNNFGGAALIIDYGHNGSKEDTFRGFRHHKVVDPLQNPGECDLTADVDFALLRSAIKNVAVTFGPITQNQFLVSMGFEQRYKALLRGCRDLEEQNRFTAACDLLISPEKMGGKFFCFGIAGHKRSQAGPLTGFPPSKDE